MQRNHLRRALRRLPVTIRASAPTFEGRSTRFREHPDGRYWWHKLNRTDYVPPLYAHLSESEWRVMEEWYAETDARQSIGEINVPPMSLIQGLVMGSGLHRIVQLGHYFGYSTLLIGSMLRAMRADPGLVSIDVDSAATDFTRKWVERAGLNDYVHLHIGDSAAESSFDRAVHVLGGGPELLIIDSSHQYAHTLRELDLWVPRLPVGAIVLMHDTSAFATGYDSTQEGGVRRAVEEWVPEHPEVSFLNLNGYVVEGTDGNALTYKDGCGLGIMQRVA